MGGGETARYVGRHGKSRLVKMVFIGAVPPLMLKTHNNPGGLPLSVFDGLRGGLVANRPQFYKDTSTAFFSYNRPNAKVSEAV
jgi:non-heme chloroperoxidase